MNFPKWSSSNGLNLNAKKCQAMEINFSRTSPHHADLKIGSDKRENILIKPKSWDSKRPEMADPGGCYA